MNPPLDRHTALALAARVSAGALSAVEVARCFIERVERLNPALNAIVQFDPGLVLAEAASVEVIDIAFQPLSRVSAEAASAKVETSDLICE